MKVVKTDNAPAAIGPYSQAIISNNFVFTSGQIPLNNKGNFVDGGIIEQTKQVMNNVKAVLEEAGSSLNHVVKATVFLKDMNDFQSMNDIYGEYFNQHRPARSCIEVSRLPKDVLIEIEVVAALVEGN